MGSTARTRLTKGFVARVLGVVSLGINSPPAGAASNPAFSIFDLPKSPYAPAAGS